MKRLFLNSPLWKWALAFFGLCALLVGSSIQTSYWNKNGTSLYYTGGNVGIGTTNPQYTLQVRQNGVGEFLRLDRAGNAGQTGGLGVLGPASTYGLGVFASGTQVGFFSSNGGLALGTYATGNDPAANGLIASGNVGIGTTSPASSLTVAKSGANGTASLWDSTATTGASLINLGYDGSGTFTGTHTSATTTRVRLVAGQAQSTTNLFEVSSNAGTAMTYIGPNYGVNVGSAVVARGTKFTISGCSAGTTVGGAFSGSFVSGTSGACTVVLTLNGATGYTAPNGWACHASDLTTPANLISQSATSTTTATLTGTTVTSDVITFGCTAY